MSCLVHLAEAHNFIVESVYLRILHLSRQVRLIHWCRIMCLGHPQLAGDGTLQEL